MPMMPRISTRFVFFGASGVGQAPMGGCAIPWDINGGDAADGVADVCPKVSCAGAENWRVYSPGPLGLGATGGGTGEDTDRV